MVNINQKEIEMDEGEKYAKYIEDLVNKMYDDNLITNINIEQIDDNVYTFNDIEIKLKFDKNGFLKLQNGTDLEKWILNNFGKELIYHSIINFSF